MSLDGLSSSNLAIYRPIDPSEVTQMTEQNAKQQAQEFIKKVEEAVQEQKIDPDAKKEKEKKQEKSLNSKKNSNEENSENNEDQLVESIKIEEKPKYNVTFNIKKNLVEMVEIETGNVIETLDPEELINVMSKFKESSGILVDKKI